MAHPPAKRCGQRKVAELRRVARFQLCQFALLALHAHHATNDTVTQTVAKHVDADAPTHQQLRLEPLCDAHALRRAIAVAGILNISLHWSGLNRACAHGDTRRC